MQVTLNQLALGPIVTTVVFTWNLLLQQRASEVPDKLKRDLVPTMVNGEPTLLLAKLCFSTCIKSNIVYNHASHNPQAGSSGCRQHQSISGLCPFSPKLCTCLFVVCCGQHIFLTPLTADLSYQRHDNWHCKPQDVSVSSDLQYKLRHQPML